MEKIRILEKEYKVSFSNRTELIQFVSKYLALQYKEHLEFWRATAMDDHQEMLVWEKRIENEVPKMEKTINKLLRLRLIFSKKLKINHKSLFLKIVFKKVGIKSRSPSNCFAINVEYKINNLVFEKDIKCQPI